MDMPAENIIVSNIITFRFIMGKNKSACLHLVIKTIDACRCIPFLFQYIVIPDNKFDRKMFKIISPSHEHFHLFILMAVKQIPNNDEIIWFEELYLRR